MATGTLKLQCTLTGDEGPRDAYRLAQNVRSGHEIVNPQVAPLYISGRARHSRPYRLPSPTDHAMGEDALPIELFYVILEEAWSLSLSRTERHDLLVALPSVCRAFHAITSRIFLRDAHLVSPAYAVHFLSLLQPTAHDHDASSPNPHLPPTTACDSITFHIYTMPTSPLSSASSGVFQLYKTSNPMTRAMEDILRSLNRPDAPLAPALRRVALRYTGWSFARELDHARLLNLPPRVQSLELCFATPDLFSQHLRQRYSRRHVLPMPGVRNLRICGTCPAFVVDVARACPALERLETDDVREVAVLQPR